VAGPPAGQKNREWRVGSGGRSFVVPVQPLKEDANMRKITPFLWFDDQAEEAAKFYCSIFEGSKIVKTTRYGEAGPGPKGSVMTVVFELAGQELIALNGGPHYKLTEAFSLSIDCKTQQEVDTYWEKLSAGGEQGPCGWLKDRYGLSWQVVPTVLPEMLADADPKRANRVMQAMMKMRKLEIEPLKKAYEG
jgi:predicted 3-demethylubiquinone-9 3-methyltransferase (glyoxalase superfamily)